MNYHNYCIVVSCSYNTYIDYQFVVPSITYKVVGKFIINAKVIATGTRVLRKLKLKKGSRD